MDSRSQKGLCQVIGKPHGKVVLKSVTVNSHTNFGCFKQSIISSLKPFFGRDAKNQLISSSFGSTPAVNVVDFHSSSHGINESRYENIQRRKLSSSAKELNKITHLGDKREAADGRKYALVKVGAETRLEG